MPLMLGSHSYICDTHYTEYSQSGTRHCNNLLPFHFSSKCPTSCNVQKSTHLPRVRHTPPSPSSLSPFIYLQCPLRISFCPDFYPINPRKEYPFFKILTHFPTTTILLPNHMAATLFSLDHPTYSCFLSVSLHIFSLLE
jgi:hypothetical protein